MSADNNLILSEKKVKQIIKRMAYEIYEQNYNEKELIIAGIAENGYEFGRILEKELSAFQDLKVRLIKVELDKLAKTQPEVKLDVELLELKNKSIVVTDDVLNTGRALTYSLKPFLSIPLKRLKTAVVVDRNHKTYPVSTDYVGYSMATTLKEHVQVSFAKGNFGVYLH